MDHGLEYQNNGDIKLKMLEESGIVLEMSICIMALDKKTNEKEPFF